MKDENVIKDKSFAFAIRIVKLYNYLTNEKKEYVLSKQILRSGTSIGANIREAVVGQTTHVYRETQHCPLRSQRDRLLD